MSQTHIQTIGPHEAWEILEHNPRAVLIDVRSTMEFLFVGHPRGAIHVPWIDAPEWTVNPDFVPHVRQLMLGGIACHGEGCAPIILICRSGHRSLDAGAKLADEGFTELYNVEHGFEGALDDNHHRSTLGGWRKEGLPWEQC